MSLHADLLEQAEQLAQLDPRRPKQANLRRAVSSGLLRAVPPAHIGGISLVRRRARACFADQPDAQPRGDEEGILDDRQRQASKGSATAGWRLHDPARFEECGDHLRQPPAGTPRGGLRPVPHVPQARGPRLRRIGAPGVRGLGASQENRRRTGVYGLLPPLETLGRGPTLTMMTWLGCRESLNGPLARRRLTIYHWRNKDRHCEAHSSRRTSSTASSPWPHWSVRRGAIITLPRLHRRGPIEVSYWALATNPEWGVLPPLCGMNSLIQSPMLRRFSAARSLVTHRDGGGAVDVMKSMPLPHKINLDLKDGPLSFIGVFVSNLLAARLQMAISLGFHILFAVVGIALPLMMAVAEAFWLRTRDPVYRILARRWARGAAILFLPGAGREERRSSSRWGRSRGRCCRSSWGCSGHTS